jgi:hypothetical protein
LKTFVAGTLNNSALVYIYDDAEGKYELNQTVPTNSQVTSVDLSQENNLLVGMMNGDLAVFSSNGQTFSPSSTKISNPNYRVFDVKLCPGGVKIAVLEKSGFFNLTIFPSGGSPPLSFTDELEDELI